MESLTLQVDGPITGGGLYPEGLISGGSYPETFFCLQVDGPITGGGGLYTRILRYYVRAFRLCGAKIRMAF